MSGDWTFAAEPLRHFLAVSAILFSAGLYTVMTRRNAVSVLMGIELILNAANVNLVGFAQYTRTGMEGNVFVVFVILLAAAEAAVGLAICLGIYRNFGVVDVDKADRMQG